jgi:shikimate dehydrogenase
MTIDHETKLNLVIGYPLGHSQSPELHKNLYEQRGINAVLLAHLTQDLPATIHAIKTLSVALTAVTIPHKETILKHLDELSDEVKALGAANTIINHNNKLKGYNTDINGIEYALRNIPLQNKTVLIIGAGGAARAAAYVMQKNKANLLFLNRTPARAEAIIKLMGGKLINKESLDDLAIDIIINTTPLGMHPNREATPLPNYRFNLNQTVFDMVYNPGDTALLKKAKADGAHIISGQDMFYGQALKQVELLMEVL